MRVLLDTHIWLWRLLEPDRVPPRIGASLDDAQNELLLSPISVWETMVLARKGRVRLEPSPVPWVQRALQESRLVMVPLTHEIAIQSEEFADFPSADPADRFLAATAVVEGLTLATADDVLRACYELQTL